MDDKKKQEHIDKVLKIVTKVDFADGSWVGGGWLDDPNFAGTDMGIRVMNRQNQPVIAFQVNMETFLIIMQVMTQTLRLYVSHKLGGIMTPLFKK